MNLDETLALARNLIRQDTTSGDACAQRQAQDFVVASAKSRHAIEVRRSSPASEHPWAVLRSPSSSAGAKSLAFVCHIDCVPVGASGDWTFPPLSAVTDEDRLYGRGSVDMKAGISAATSAFVHACELGSAVDLVLTSDEEIGSLGAEACLDELDGFSTAAAIIPEATNNLIALGHRGALWARLSSHGRAAHGSTPTQGINAIMRLASNLRAGIDSLPLRSADYLGTETVNVGTIGGGVAVNIVPDHASVTLDLRTVGDHDDLRSALVSWPGVDDLDTLVDLPPVTNDSGDSWIASIPAATLESPVPYFTDAAILRRALPDCPIIVCGPGDPSQMHADDEHLPLSALHDCRELFHAIVNDWASTSARN